MVYLSYINIDIAIDLPGFRQASSYLILFYSWAKKGKIFCYHSTRNGIL